MEDRMGGVCNKHSSDNKHVQNVGYKTWKEETTWKMKWWALANTVMSINVPEKVKISFNNWATTSFWRMTLLYGAG
jgi:hypothetical protein